ncbi:hypothetical protein B0A48_14207 [Cryoendolithus antarcticus]|uniref:DUF7918 domain-containing protein n=1 Tax=Cryoendolithus antarcticus TaxID=1507870 RepID=A0A1V8SLP4_9PEZI|nr:hypothetical protein B0A48_14207 [Cryoendolithus antarcticus]
MVSSQGIEVYVVRYRNHNTRYPEYAVPMESTKYNGNPREVYIEALTDDRFAIIVDLTESFNPKGCPALQMICSVDASKADPWTIFTRSMSQLKEAGQGVGRASLKGRFVFDHECKNVNGAVVRYGFAFGALAADETIDLCKEEVDQAAETKKVRGEHHAPDHESIGNIAEAAKDVVKDSFVSHTVKSREALQKLNIIPADPPAQTARSRIERAGSGRQSLRDATLSADPEDRDVVQIDNPEAKIPKKVKARKRAALESATTSSKKSKREALEDELRAVALERKELRLKQQLRDLEGGEGSIKPER